MKPILFELPFLGWTIKGYGLMLMIGFLLATWLAGRRAAKVKADPDVMINAAFVALLAGIAGARLWYYIHYYDTQFANRSILALIDISSGGLEFLGGFLLGMTAVMIYFVKKHVSIRLYLDIVAPSIMLGLAFGRVGCTLNGCCFGSICADEKNTPRLPWTITFPYGSPAHSRQWQNIETTLPEELIVVGPSGLATPLPRESVYNPPPDNLVAQLNSYTDRLERARFADKHSRELRKHGIFLAQTSIYGKTPAELAAMATHYRSLPVQPTQLYSCINALMVWIILAIIFRIRRRQGVVMPWMFIIYGASRMILEQIRSDNPHDVWIFTISQATSAGMIAVGILALLLLQLLPERSPRAIAAIPQAS